MSWLPLTPDHGEAAAAMSTTNKVPETMGGVQIKKTGGPEVLEYKTDLPVPTPKAGEVLVKNEAIGINYIDTSGPIPIEFLARPY